MKRPVHRYRAADRRSPPSSPRAAAVAPTSAAATAGPKDDLAPEMRHLLEAGHLEQTCPCGKSSAATYYCYACLRPTGPEYWGRHRSRVQADGAAIEGSGVYTATSPEQMSFGA